MMEFAIYRKADYNCPNCANAEGALYCIEDATGSNRSQVHDISSVLNVASLCISNEDLLTLASRKVGELVWLDVFPSKGNLPDD